MLADRLAPAVSAPPSRVSTAGAVEGGEVGPDLAGLGQPEVGVEGQGPPIMVTRGGGIAEGEVGMAQAGVGAGLLIAVADVGGDGVGGGVVGEGVRGVAGGLRR